MQQIQQPSFSQKAKQIRCLYHQSSVISMNIGKNVNPKSRLLCKQCKSLGQSVLFLNEVSEYLKIQYEEEQQQMLNIRKQYDEKIYQLFQQLNEKKKEFDKFFEHTNQEIQLIYDQFNQNINDQSESELKSIINLISQETLKMETLQTIAQFLSKQTIFEGKLESSQQYLLSDIENEQMKRKYDQIKYSITALNLSLISSPQTVLPQNVQTVPEVQSNTSFSICEEIMRTQNENKLIYNCPRYFNEHKKQIGAVAMSNDESMIASGDWAGIIIIRKISNLRQIQKFDKKYQIVQLKFSYDDKYLAITHWDGDYDIILLEVASFNDITPNTLRLQNNLGTIWRIQFTFDSQYLISGGGSNQLKVWDINTREMNSSIILRSCINGIGISNNQKQVSVCCQCGTAYLFKLSDKKELSTIVEWKPLRNQISCTGFTKDNEYVLTSGKNICIWNIEEILIGNHTIPVRVFQGKNSIWSFELLFEDQLLISIDDKIKIWDCENGQLVCQLNVPSGYSYTNDKTFAVSKNLKYIVTGGRNQKLKLYELKEN